MAVTLCRALRLVASPGFGLAHSNLAWLIADGEHPKAIQARLGDGSIAVTVDRYGHPMDELDHQIVLHLTTVAGIGL